eukprot:GCRY01000982.1.p1 GENE.GCRY01000982.1~~GCRY01000982.1.p1  ORF type:complete len:120 (-),score=10.74 GCRY01000982.1:38-397(-)
MSNTEEKIATSEPASSSSEQTSVSAPSAESSSEVVPKSETHLNLKVVSSDGNEVFFKIKRVTPLNKLMKAYCQRVGVEFESVRFLFDGERITADKTPNDYDMEDNDEIEVHVAQIGGWC